MANARTAAGASSRRRALALAAAIAGLSAVAAVAWPGASDATFPGTNGNVAFASELESGPEFAIFSIKPDSGTEAVQLTDEDGFADLHPGYSPDGRTIVFSRQPSNSPNETLWTMDADGSDETSLNVAGGEPAYSPDGSRIAFTNEGDIWIMDADGSDQKRLTDSPNNQNADFSPDGDRIAFERGLDADAEVWDMRTNGTDQKQLTDDPDYGASNPSYSPDGSEIAFANLHTSVMPNVTEIWVMDADGQNPSQVTDVAADREAPSFSPDGTKIAYQRDVIDSPGDGDAIYTVDFDGSDDTELFTNPNQLDTVEPAWGALPPGATCNGHAASIFGSEGADTIPGTPGRDIIVGLDGDDALGGSGDNDLICGGSGDDSLNGGARSDRLRGGSGDDELGGKGGGDRLEGGSGDDELDGGAKSDRCEGGSGSDSLESCER